MGGIFDYIDFIVFCAVFFCKCQNLFHFTNISGNMNWNNCFYPMTIFCITL